MNEPLVREKLADLAMLDGCELSTAQLDRLVGIFRAGYDLAMPHWAYEMLPSRTIEERAYKLGHMARLVYLRGFLCKGRTKIIRKK